MPKQSIEPKIFPVGLGNSLVLSIAQVRCILYNPYEVKVNFGRGREKEGGERERGIFDLRK